MIVDDEFLVRVGLKSLINWEAHGYTLVPDASNGKEALERIPKYRPDIILTDLVMEPVDGITLIQKGKALYPEICFIVLSNYNDFDHVKEAMKQGAKDFLFKITASGEDLLKVLDSVSKNIQKEATQNAFLEKDRNSIKQRVGNMLINHTYENEDAFAKDLDLAGLSVDLAKYFLALRICLSGKEGMFQEDGNQSVMLSSLNDIIQESVAEFFPSNSFIQTQGVFIILLNTDRDTFGPLLKQKLDSCFVHVQREIMQYANLQIYATTSTIHQGFLQVRKAINEAQASASQSFFLQKQNIVFPDECHTRTEHLDIPEALEPGIWNTYMEASRIIDCKTFITAAASWLFSSQSNMPSIFATREYFHQLCKIFKSSGMLHGIDIDAIKDRYGKTLFTAIKTYDLLSEMIQSFEEVLSAYANEMVAMPQGNLHVKTSDAIVYVKTHLSEKMTIDIMAKQLDISSSHFSHIFKEDMGMGFVEYLNNARIKKAKELLSTTDEPVSRIGEMVGISNSNYFSYLFRKLVSYSPVEYRMHKAEFR